MRRFTQCLRLSLIHIFRIQSTEKRHFKGQPHVNLSEHNYCIFYIHIFSQFSGIYRGLTRADYCRMTGHDKQRAINELNIFIERGLLIRYGAGKLVIYAKKKEETAI